LPLRDESILDVRARFDADANAGIDPSDPAFKDLTVGGFYYDVTQPAVMECARLWDFFSTEVPAVAFPAYAFGEYLDEHGITVNVPRKDGVKATGEVTFTGTNGTQIPSGTTVAVPQDDPDADPIIFETTASDTIGNQATPNGTITIPVQAVETGPAGNVPTGAVTELLTGIEGVESVTNASAITGGADVESDELYRERILLEYANPHGAGTIADYERWALGFPPVGYVTVVPLWNGPGTVQVVVTDQENNPVSNTVKDGLQAALDPVPGEGRGLAPIGATVTVDTPVLFNVDVQVELVLDEGYSIDGAAGTTDVSATIEDAIRDYIDTLPPGSDVIRNKVIEAIMLVPGVLDLQNLLMNGSAGNLSVASLQVPQTDDVTLNV
jgi:uncharacterized phage protein gp47/JayE